MNDELEELRQKCRDLQEQAGQLMIQLHDRSKELEDMQAEVTRKTDLCTMYEHMLDERSAEMEKISAENESALLERNHAITRMNNLFNTIDVLAARIADLTK